MDAQILINSIDQTGYLVSITRSYNYCNVSQEFTIELDLSCPTTINTYDSVVIYEEGTKVLTGFVSSISKSAPEAKISVKGQDTFVKATDFFVPEIYTTDFGQTAEYWVTFLLNLAGLTAVFTDGAGPYLIAEQDIGLAAVADLVVPILQYAGWYARVDENGTIIVGKIDKTPISEPIREGIAIIQDGIEQSYDKTRNKAIVFGGVDTTLNRFELITAIANRDLSFLPVDQTVVVGNPYIVDQDSAQDFADALANEFARPTQIKNLTILGNPIYQAGKYVEIFSELFTGIALITSFKSNFSDQGYIMDLILDDPCPRVVGAIKHQPELYAGTDGNGVWAYNMYSGAWEDISSGLTNLYINDLSVDNGLYITATPAGIFTKLASDPWVKQNLPLYSGSDGTLVYSGVYANLFDTQVHAIVTSVRSDYNYAWFYTGTIASGGTGFRWSGSPIYDIDGAVTSGRYYSATDLEGNYGTKFISTRYQLDNRADKTYYVVSGIHMFSMGLYGQGQAPVHLSDGSEIYEQPAVSHDGTRLVFASNIQTPLHNDIYTSNLDGTSVRRLTFTGFGSYYPSWSLDDTKIVFVQEFALDAEIYIMNADGSEQEPVTSGATSYYKHPRYIDTHKIAYSKVTGVGFYNIYVIDDNGTNELQITNNAYDTNIYNYSTGQLRALYTTNGGAGFDDVYSINTDGSDNQQLLTDSGANITSPSLTDDGRLLIYESGGQIRIIGVIYIDTFALNNVANASVALILGNEDYNYVIFANSNDLYRIEIDATNETHLENPTPPLRMNLFHLNTGYCKTRAFYSNYDLVNDADGRNNDGWKYYDGTDIISLPTLSYPADSAYQFKFNNGGPAPNSTGTKLLGIASRNGTNTNCDLFEVDVTTGIMSRLTSRDDAFANYTHATNSSMVRLGYNYDDTLRIHSYNNQVYINEVAVVTGVFLDWIGTSNDFCYIDGTVNPKKIYRYNYSDSTSSLIYTLNTNSGSSVWVIEVRGTHTTDDLIVVNEHSGTITNLRRTYVSTLYSNSKDLLNSSPSANAALDWTIEGDGLLHVGNGLTSSDLFLTSPDVLLASGTQPFHRTMIFTPKTRVFETFDNQTFFLVFEDSYLYGENNVDTYSPITVYGRDGNFYSEDFITYSGTIASGLITYDVAAKYLVDEKVLFATTTSGIYRTVVSGQPALRNTVAAREIVSRYYGSGEVFFSVGAEVKKSLDECLTYTDISSGLPGSTITVLRLDK